MCRFALIKSSKPIKPEEILQKFSIMAKNSPAYDGDWQGDGWGISYLNEQNIWQIYKSLKPVWEEQNIFDRFPSTNMFAIHARSASFADHKGKIEYNQPYINNQFAFVFNGLLKKVHFKERIPGEIGAQKLFYLLNKVLQSKKSESPITAKAKIPVLNDFGIPDPSADGSGRVPTGSEKRGIELLIINALYEFETLLKNNVDEIQACNIGLSNSSNIYALNLYSKHPDYYQLHSLNTPDLKIICSRPLEGFNLIPIKEKIIML